MSKYTGERFLPDECRGEMAVEHYQRYLFARQLTAGKKVLDAACGEGYGSSLLAETAEEVTGLDIDEDAVKRASQKYGGKDLTFLCGSIENLPLEDHSVDVVVSYETIEHVGESVQKHFLEEIRRVLKEDGFLIMSTPNKAVYTDRVKGSNPFHVHEFYAKEYEEFLKNYFSNLEIYCQYPDVGYFITKDEESTAAGRAKAKSREECRYILAVCSNVPRMYSIEPGELVFFEDQMYYDLNRYAHEKDQQILQMKAEAESFEKQLESSIREQKKYIRKLEDDLMLLKHPVRTLYKHRKHLFRYLKRKMRGK